MWQDALEKQFFQLSSSSSSTSTLNITTIKIDLKLSTLKGFQATGIANTIANASQRNITLLYPYIYIDR